MGDDVVDNGYIVPQRGNVGDSVSKAHKRGSNRGSNASAFDGPKRGSNRGSNDSAFDGRKQRYGNLWPVGQFHLWPLLSSSRTCGGLRYVRVPPPLPRVGLRTTATQTNGARATSGFELCGSSGPGQPRSAMCDKSSSWTPPTCSALSARARGIAVRRRRVMAARLVRVRRAPPALQLAFGVTVTQIGSKASALLVSTSIVSR